MRFSELHWCVFFQCSFTAAKKTTSHAPPDVHLVQYFSDNNSCDDLRTKFYTGGAFFKAALVRFFNALFTHEKTTGVATADVTLVLYFSRNNSCDDLRTKFYTGGRVFQICTVRSFFNALFTDVKTTGVALPDVHQVQYFSYSASGDSLRTKFYTGTVISINGKR